MVLLFYSLVSGSPVGLVFDEGGGGKVLVERGLCVEPRTRPDVAYMTNPLLRTGFQK